jgi:cold shock CspA family protein
VARGTVKWFSEDKGYGFIGDEEEGFFVHYTEVEFEIAEVRRGTKQATRVEVVGWLGEECSAT